MSRLSDISSNPVIAEFAQGAAQDAVMPVADFLAPAVNVATSTGRYKVYTEKNRFHVPDTLRAIGGRATEIRFEATDATYNCEPNAIDYPVDHLEQLEEEALGNRLREGAIAIAEIAALSHEKKVIDLALATVGAGTAKTWNSSADPVDDIDDAILTVIKNAAFGSAMNIGVLFGATAFRIFKNAAAVKDRFVIGSGTKGLAVPNEAQASQMFVGGPEVRTSYMVQDTAPEGKTKDMSFLLDTSVLVFARKQQPTRHDPSFMKTFRLAGKWMTPGSYMRDDGRVEVAKFDWSEDIVATNSTACVRYVISAS